MTFNKKEYTVEEATQKLNVTYQTVLHWIKEGKIEVREDICDRNGRKQYFISEKAIKKFKKNNGYMKEDEVDTKIAADILKVSVSTIRYWIKNGKLKARETINVNNGKSQYLISQEELTRIFNEEEDFRIKDIKEEMKLAGYDLDF